jgi:hypothetical protein
MRSSVKCRCSAPPQSVRRNPRLARLTAQPQRLRRLIAQQTQVRLLRLTAQPQCLRRLTAQSIQLRLLQLMPHPQRVRLRRLMAHPQKGRWPFLYKRCLSGQAFAPADEPNGLSRPPECACSCGLRLPLIAFRCVTLLIRANEFCIGTYVASPARLASFQ